MIHEISWGYFLPLFIRLLLCNFSWKTLQHKLEDYFYWIFIQSDERKFSGFHSSVYQGNVFAYFLWRHLKCLRRKEVLLIVDTIFFRDLFFITNHIELNSHLPGFLSLSENFYRLNPSRFELVMGNGREEFGVASHAIISFIKNDNCATAG